MMSSSILTLRRAIILALVTGLLIPAALMAGSYWLKTADQNIKSKTQELLQKNADLLLSGIQVSLRLENAESAAAFLAAMMRNEDIVRIVVTDNAQATFARLEQAERRTAQTTSTKKTVFYGENPIGEIEIEVSSARLKKTATDTRRELLIAFALQILLSIALIMILLERRVIGPLQRLGKGAERLAARQLDVPFTWKRQDEIGWLSQRLEATRISLSNLFDELEKKNQELEHDLDQRKQIEQQLQEREERFRVLVEQSPIAIIEWDIYYCVIEWNAAAEKIFGYTRKQALGQHASFVTASRTQGTVNEFFRKLIAGTGATGGLSRNRRANGDLIFCQWSNTHIAGKAGRAGRLISMCTDITEQRRAEEAYHLSQAKFASAFNGSPDFISISRISDSTLVDFNEAYEKFTGFQRDTSIGKTALNLGLWPHPEERMTMVEQVLQTGVARELPITLRSQSGELRSCVANANAFNIDNELHMLCIISDFTEERRMAEQKAEADRALLRLAQGMQGMSGETFFEFLVADLASVLRTDSAFLGMRMTDNPERMTTIAHFSKSGTAEPFDYAIPGSPCETVIAGDIRIYPAKVQALFPHDPGLVEHGWESYAGAPIRDSSGKPIGVLSVMHSAALDNSDLVRSLLQIFSERASAELERKRAEEALRNSEQQFAAMFHASPVSMTFSRFGGDRVILDVNTAFEQLFLRERSQVIGHDALELSLYCEAKDRESIIYVLQQNGHIDRYETWMNLGDGSRALIQLSGSLFELGGEKFIIFSGENVTEKHIIENEVLELNATLEMRVIERTEELQQANDELGSTLDTLNMAQDELVRSEKLAALGSLVAGIAHELNTPIGNSLMVASTLVDRTRTFTESANQGLKRSMLDSYVQDAAKAGEILVRNLYRAADLVTSFKQVAVDQTSSQRRNFSLSEVIAEIMLTLSPTIRKTPYHVKQSIPKKIQMNSYPGPLGQVISNLINNALIHAFEHRDTGTISITAQLAAEGWVELLVQDDGVGIPHGNRNRIFDPFFTTKLGAGGSGLGLNITHNIVTSVLGGRVRVQSEEGTGSTFILSLPLTAP